VTAHLDLGRAFFWELARTTGSCGLILSTLSVSWGILLTGRGIRPALTGLDLHRFLSTLALTAVAVHVVALVADAHAKVPLRAVVGASDRIPLVLGAVALWLMMALPATFALKRWKLLSHAAWRRLHYAGYATWAVALAHGVATGSDTRSPVAIALYGGLAGLVAALAAWRVAARRASTRSRIRDGAARLTRTVEGEHVFD
jgi:methionine sulfoxide reductase heme-binding subunit